MRSVYQCMETLYTLAQDRYMSAQGAAGLQINIGQPNSLIDGQVLRGGSVSRLRENWSAYVLSAVFRIPTRL